MSTIDGRVVSIEEILGMTPLQLAEAGLEWIGRVSVEPNTYSAAAKQAVCDILVELHGRVLNDCVVSQ